MLRRRRPESAPPKRRRRIRKLRLLVLLAVLGVLGLVSFTYGMITAIASQIPALEPARQQHLQVNGIIYASDGHRVLAILRGSQSRVLVETGEIAPIMRQAIVAIEDKRFYEHRGIDVRGMARALWADITQRGAVQGGSTITQQFVKNAYVGNERTVTRKLKEAALAWQLEQRWKKDRILTAYLNTIYFGNGAYGIQQAAQTYFGEGASQLTLPRAALLAGIPSDPSLWDPVAHPREARARRDVVLDQMVLQGDVTPQEAAAAKQVPLPRPEDVHLPGTSTTAAPYFTNYVVKQLVDRYGPKKVYGGGLRVTTTIDLGLQAIARDAIAKVLPNPDGATAALVALDPRNGHLLAMVGGRNYHQSQFNLAVQGERQPGSSFKPFVLATALSQGISPQTTLVSKPVTIDLGDKLWVVHNYENAYAGPMSLWTATAESDNTVFAQLTRLVGPANVARTAHALGIQSRLPGYFAIGLGGLAVNPLEMARAYAAFANGGKRLDGSLLGNEPIAVTAVNGRENAVVPRQKLTPDTAALVTQALQGVVTSGTGRAAALPDRPVAGKTGTTENYGDAWFCGYVPQLVTCVWVGYPNRLVPMLHDFHGGPVVGGSFPAQIWKAFAQPALKRLGEAPEPFAAPPSVYGAPRKVAWRDGRIELDNGYCRDTLEVVYFASGGPARTANCKPNEVDVPRVVGQTVAAAQARLASQPLEGMLVYKPAKPLQRLGVVLAQYPSGGTLSSHDRVLLVVAKPLHGVVPRVVGLSVARAKARLIRAKLGVKADGDTGTVVSQSPPAGVAAAPGMAVRLSVRSG
ncbi:MAG TPA: PBP1A family penicillin-binding protein [Gaiellaceae bacterium]